MRLAVEKSLKKGGAVVQRLISARHGRRSMIITLNKYAHEGASWRRKLLLESVAKYAADK